MPHTTTLAFDQGMLLVVEGRRIVFEMLDERAGLGPFVKHLGLAFVDTTPPVHPGYALWPELTIPKG